MPSPANATSRFSRARGLPRAAYDSWVASMRQEPCRPARILAWCRAVEESEAHEYCIGSPAVLSWGSAQGWRHVGWHQIEHGGWNSELHQLSWAGLDGRRGAVLLHDPGRLPELFRERVEASIAVERFVSLSGERGVVISARRDLGAGGATTWHTRLTRGLTWRTEGVQEAVDAALAETRAEYDMG